MKKAHLVDQSRRSLDTRFAAMPPTAQLRPPVRGWIKAIREALGMSSAQLAKRLGIAQPSVFAIEQSEHRGAIQLSTLRRVAEAMDCTLVYALVPNQPLDTTVRDRARQIARRNLEPVAHSMALENQAVPAEDFEARIDALARDLNPRRLWDET